jgi:hypothetical protein
MRGFCVAAVGGAAAWALFTCFGAVPASAGEPSPASIAAGSATGQRAAGEIRALPLLRVAAGPSQPPANDYPTATRADYVIGCMAANGNTREALLKCSCAIDTIAALMPYAHYEEAETALSLQAGGGLGGRVGLFRDPPEIKAVIEELRRAQAEANLQCR